MTFREWYYTKATEAERIEAQEVARKTAGIDPDFQLRRRTEYKLKKLCTGKGWTIEKDPTCFYLRWRVVPTESDTVLQFGSSEEAHQFCREEKRTVADWLRTIEPIWLMVEGRAVMI